MRKEMKKLGISIKDSEDNMKPLDVLLGDLRESFSGLSEDQQASSASAIFGKQAMAGMLAVINAGEGDFNKLSKAIENSDGVAKQMASTMQNNLQGKLTNLKSALEELAIKLFDALEPALTKIVEAFQKLVDWMNGLSKNTQMIVVSIGALVAAIGPLLLILGPLLSMVGSMMVTLPVLVPIIAGLAGPIGIVVASLTALGVAFALTRTKADETLREQTKLAENNLELAKSYSEVLDEKSEQLDKTSELLSETKKQIEVTDELVDTYEGLAEKSKLTTEEFGEFLTLQTELGNTKSPEKIAEIESEMEKLRKKSGLSKEEFNRLLESNQALSEQFPESGRVIDDYGNIIMDTTGKLRDMTNAELERMEVEVYNRMAEDIRDVNREIDEYAVLLGESLVLEDSIDQAKKEIENTQFRIYTNEKAIKENREKILELHEQAEDATFKEKTNLLEIAIGLEEEIMYLEEKNKKHKENVDELKETVDVENENLEVIKEQRDTISDLIDKNNQNYDAYVQILEVQYDINLERGKENEAIDEAIEKRKETIKHLEDQIKKEGDSNGEKQESLDKLEKEISNIEDVKGRLDRVNDSLDTQNEKYTTAENNLAKVDEEVKMIGENTRGNVKRAEAYNEIAGEDIKKKVEIKTNKDAEDENEKWKKPVKKVVNVVTSAYEKLKFWKDGTNFHPGGPAVLGEGSGPELVEHNGRLSLASFGLYDLPMGAKVHTHEDTVSMLRNGLVSGIDKGLSLQRGSGNSIDFSGMNTKEMVVVLKEQNDLLLMLLQKDANIYFDGREIAYATEPYMTEIQNRNIDVNNSFR